ncbi:MAG: STAS domain-containing protein [Desulfohalobiaceae bacterium]
MQQGQARENFVLEGDCGVEKAAWVHQELLKILDKGVDLDLDLSQVSRTDASLQQIICAAHRSFAARNQDIRLQPRPSQAVLENLERGGFGQVCVFTLQNCLFKGAKADG